MKQETGLTLLELLITIMVLAIFATIAIPNYNAYLPKSRANGAARELFSELQAARMRAISDNNDYVVAFSTLNDIYAVYDDDDGDGPETHEKIKSIRIPDTFPGIGFGYVPGNNPSGNPITSEVTFTGNKVTFKPTGLASPAGAVYLIPGEDVGASRKDRSRAVTVLLSGRVRLYSHTGTGWE
jgi:prepilin-type N-terminal cleavage/methylation domain-containing protein